MGNEQGVVELLAHLTKAMAHGRLRDPQAPRRARHALLLEQHREHGEQVQVFRPPMFHAHVYHEYISFHSY